MEQKQIQKQLTDVEKKIIRDYLDIKLKDLSDIKTVLNTSMLEYFLARKQLCHFIETWIYKELSTNKERPATEQEQTFE